jgi:hypothetical protein
MKEKVNRRTFGGFLADFPFSLGGEFDAGFAAFVDAVSFFASLETRVSAAPPSDASASADRFLGGITTRGRCSERKSTRETT